MKKFWRVLAVLTALTLLCIATTGCNAIDTMRAHHILRDNDNSLTLNGTRYVELQTIENFCPLVIEQDYAYITKPDVPVLLSEMLGTEVMVINGGRFIAYGNDSYYCAAKEHDEIIRRLNEGFTPTGYAFTYEHFDAKKAEYETRIVKLTEPQSKAIDSLVTSGNDVDDAVFEADITVELYACNDTDYMSDYIGDLIKRGDQYAIIITDHSGGDYGEYRSRIYYVPDEQKPLFQQILQAAIDSREAEKAYYRDQYGADWGDEYTDENVETWDDDYGYELM